MDTLQLYLNFPIALVAVLLTIVLLVSFYWPKPSEQFNRIPGPSGWPVIRNLNEIVFSSDHLGMALVKLIRRYSNDSKFAGMFKMDFIVDRLVFLNTPDTVQALFVSRNHRKLGNLSVFSPLFGNGLFSSNGQKWSHDRKQLTAGFNKQSLDNYFGSLNTKSAAFADHLGNQTVVNDLLQLTLKFSLECVLFAALEVDEHIESASLLNYSKELTSVFEIGLQRILNLALRIDLIFNISGMSKRFQKSVDFMKSFAMGVYRKRRASMTSDADINGNDILTMKCRSILQSLMQLNHKEPVNYNETAIIDHLNTFIATGNDIPGICLCMTIYHLANNLDCQSLLFDGISQLGDTFSSDDVNGLPYLDAVVKESLRISTPVPILGRNLEDDLKVGSCVIPRNTEVMVCVEVIHMSEQLYVEPKMFKPERWLVGNEDMRSSHPFSYMPFSGGLRNCIGKKFAVLELKLAIIHIVRKFRVELLNSDELRMDYSLSMKPVSPVSVAFNKRNDD